jgi:hypothetical protein
MASYSFSAAAIVSASWDPLIWAASLFIPLICLFLGLICTKNTAIRRFSLVPILCVLGGLTGAAVLGFLSVVSLALVSLMVLIICIYFSDFLGLSPTGLLKRVLLGCVLTALLIELAALALFNLPYTLNLSVAADNWRLTELYLSNLAYPALPYAYLFFIVLGTAAFIITAVPAIRFPKAPLLTRLQGFIHQVRRTVSSLKEQEFEPLSSRFPLILALLVSIVISVLFVAITVLPWFNPTNRLVSVDSPVYYEWLDRMRSLDVPSALQFALTNDRALFLVLSYLLSFVVYPVEIMQFIPALLVPLFCLVSLFIIKLVCNLRDAWVYAVLIVPFSIQALGLIYSGYFANMLAAIFVYLYFIVLLKFSDSGRWWNIPLLLGISLLILFSHSWTWYIFAASLGAFLFLEWQKTAKEPAPRQNLKRKMLIVGGTAILGLSCDLARKLLISSSGSLSVFETAQSSLGLPNTAFILSGLKLTTNFYLGGVFSSAVILALCITGLLFMLTFKSDMSRLLICWFAVGCTAVLFASTEFVFNRFMFLMPSLIFASLGLSFLARFSLHTAGSSHVKRVCVELLVVGLVFLFLLNFALRYVCNINIF